MGYDATNVLPEEVKKEKLIDFIKLLGYEGKGNEFHFYKKSGYTNLFGVHISIEGDYALKVHTRTPIYCNDNDLAYQNYTMREIKRYLGGYFISDYGKNRYFPIEKECSSVAYRGCYAARFRIHNPLSTVSYLVTNYKEEEAFIGISKIYGIATPSILLSNLTTTFLSSIIEQFFRETYLALLMDSPRKEKLLLDSRIRKEDYLEIANGNLSIEEAFSLSISFQNINKINSNFRDLDSKIDIKGILSKPYRRRKEKLYETLNRILDHRHALVHRMDINPNYTKEHAIRDIESVKVSLEKVFSHLCNLYGWK